MKNLLESRVAPAFGVPYTFRPGYLFWLFLAVCMLGMNFLPGNLIDPFSTGDTANSVKIKPDPHAYEFEQSVALKFTSVDNLYLYLLTHTRDTSDKYLILQNAEKLLKKRFVHAYAVYSLNENWMAVLAGKLVWRNLSAKVIPDDILKGNVAACSQVSIVFMALCRKFDIPTRKVGLSGHYTIEAFVSKKWYFFDLDIKPDFQSVNGHKSLSNILKQKEQYALYKNTVLDSTDVDRVFSTIEYGIPNRNPAPRAALFHRVTKILSNWGWLIPFYIGVSLFLRRAARWQTKLQQPTLSRK